MVTPEEEEGKKFRKGRKERAEDGYRTRLRAQHQPKKNLPTSATSWRNTLEKLTNYVKPNTLIVSDFHSFTISFIAFY